MPGLKIQKEPIIIEILRILTRAEQLGSDILKPLQLVDDRVAALQDEDLSYLYEALLEGYRTETADTQAWADNYFTFILLLTGILSSAGEKANPPSQTYSSKLILA